MIPGVLAQVALRRRHKQKCQRYESTLPRYLCNLSSPPHFSTLLSAKFFYKKPAVGREFRRFIWEAQGPLADSRI